LAGEIATMTEPQQNVEELLRRFEVPLLQYATRITGNSERARDVVQEVFIKLQRNGAVAPNKTATWLFTVCRNGALNVCRKEKRMMYLDKEIIALRRDEQPMPFERIEQREASGFLMKILATLPPRQQEVLQLKFQNDLSYQEIAEITKTTANSVGVLIHTALKTLRERYREASKDFLPFQPRTT
jgi:RNA polymerase sigma-70 factor (ECF subfamily)